jgi:3-oxoacyl-[acyl-carrier protein] reductase
MFRTDATAPEAGRTPAIAYCESMDLGISGKVAMVAASSKGIGLAIAKALAQEGCLVSMCARTEDVLEEAAAEVGHDARPFVVDVADREDLEWWIQQTRDDLGPVDILVTNSGGPPAGRLEDITDEQWMAGVDSTLMNIVRLVRLAEPDMRASGWGRIVHITSVVAKEPNPLLPISSTLRAGVLALTRLQATELGPHGITVNGVLPGHTLTDRQRHLASIRAEKEEITLEEALESQGQKAALRRLADPDEIASVVAFLCSQRASYVTGTSLLVDGGVSANLG